MVGIRHRDLGIMHLGPVFIVLQSRPMPGAPDMSSAINIYIRGFKTLYENLPSSLTEIELLISVPFAVCCIPI